MSNRLPAAQMIAQSIEDDIAAGRLVLGFKLQQDALAKKHKTSRIPVREALAYLLGRGLVDHNQDCGFFVSGHAMGLAGRLEELQAAIAKAEQQLDYGQIEKAHEILKEAMQ